VFDVFDAALDKTFNFEDEDETNDELELEIDDLFLAEATAGGRYDDTDS
jgi:hypothetical protein